MMSTEAPITQIINKSGESLTPNEQLIYERVYQQLKVMAKNQKYKIRNEEINTTQLVNEAWLKLKGTDKIFTNRSHFYAVSSLAMKHILINESIKKKNKLSSTLTENLSSKDKNTMKEIDFILDLELKLKIMAKISPRLEKVFIYRFFGDMAHNEIAEVLDIDPRTVDRDWKKIKIMMATATSMHNNDH